MILKNSNLSVRNFFINSSKNISILNDRRLLLLKIAEAIAVELTKSKIVNLNFICTHNSRRSQLCQVWSFFASHYFKLNINAFSGGTEVTAFHRNAIKTLQQVGFSFHLEDFSHQNPKYSISFDDTDTSILGFSKFYNNPINIAPFMAITNCNDADTNCPFITAASHRFHLPYEDPKSSDGKELQDETYLKINEKIAGEIFFIFSKVKELLS